MSKKTFKFMQPKSAAWALILVELRKNIISQKEIDFYKIRYLAKEGARLTRYGCSPIVLGKAKIDFSYRRDNMDLRLERKDWKFLGIPNLSPAQKAKPFLTNSGQAAINAIFFYLKNLMQSSTIQLINEDQLAYKGTLDTLALYGLSFSKTPQTAGWICSMGYKAGSFKPHTLLKLLVIDTTCWNLNSTELKEIFKKIPKSCLVLLLRSHSKLDMGGVEYGSLGSLVIIGSRQKVFSAYCENFKEILRITGGLANIDEIPPFMFMADFYKKSVSRQRDIEQNVESIMARLRSFRLDTDRFQLIFPEHKKYFYVHFKYLPKEKEISSYLRKLNKLATFYQIELRQVDSFGFNFPTLTSYATDGGHCIRIYPGPHTVSVDKLIHVIQATFS